MCLTSLLPSNFWPVHLEPIEGRQGHSLLQFSKLPGEAHVLACLPWQLDSVKGLENNLPWDCPSILPTLALCLQTSDLESSHGPDW